MNANAPTVRAATIVRITLLVLAASTPPLCAAAGSLTVTAVNPLPLARPNETIELSAQDLQALPERDLRKIHVQDGQGKELLVQAVDTDFDELHKPDIVIFQADFAPGETKSFRVTVGGRHVYTHDDFRTHGRFVRERFDDFAWENDRIAHRTYGKALESWKGEPQTSSAIDIWSKRTPRLVIDDWYLVDNYHADTGEGGDFYSAGATRGCGGDGLWAADRLWVSRNFVESRVLANGPIRVMFELVYEAFDVNGNPVSEVKRITLDAGSQLDHFQSFYKPRPGAILTTGIGLKKVDGEVTDQNAKHGWFAAWEPMEKNTGNQGLAVIVDPDLFEKQTSDRENLLLLVQTPGNVASYWAGFGWDRAGRFTTFNAWKSYIDEFSQRLHSPLEIRIHD